MQPLQYDLGCPAAKDNNITCAVATPNLDAAITIRSAQAELQSARELRETASEIAAPKPDESRRPKREKKSDFEALSKEHFKRKNANTKIEKTCWQITTAALMRPLQYDFRYPTA